MGESEQQSGLGQNFSRCGCWSTEKSQCTTATEKSGTKLSRTCSKALSGCSLLDWSFPDAIQHLFASRRGINEYTNEDKYWRYLFPAGFTFRYQHDIGHLTYASRFLNLTEVFVSKLKWLHKLALFIGKEGMLNLFSPVLALCFPFFLFFLFPFFFFFCFTFASILSFLSFSKGRLLVLTTLPGKAGQASQ